MKISYVVQYYPPHTGGLEQVAKKLATEAVSRGHRVSVITFALSHSDISVREEEGVSVHRVRGFHFLDSYFNIPFCFGGFGMYRTLKREVESADMVHVHDVFYPTSWFAYLFSWWYKKPLILTQHVALVAHTSTLVMGVQRFVYAVFGALIFKKARKIFVYNAIVRDFLIGQGVSKEKIIEAKNGVAVEEFHPVNDSAEIHSRRKQLGLPVDRPLVLFVGRLVPKKGFMELYKARDPMFDIVFVGPGTVPEEWYATKGVHILGEKTQEELLYIYPIVDVFVSPTKGELFTLVMQEAFACGLPVVTTNEPEYAEYDVDRNAIAFCAPHSDEIKKSIKRIIGDTVLRRNMKSYSRGLAERLFDWKKNYGAVITVCEKVLEKEKQVIVTTSWDDGHVLDVKLASLLQKYGIAGTFYIAPHNYEQVQSHCLRDEDVKKLSDVFEIGAHTLVHKKLTHLSSFEAQKEIGVSKKYLENILNKPVTSFCYPSGAYTKEHVRMVEEAGYTLARTVRRFVFHPSLYSPYTMPTSVHTYDHWSDIWNVALFARCNPVQFFALYRKWDAIAMAMFDRVQKTGGVFHLWGHSLEIEEHGDWGRLENVLRYIAHREGVTYTTNSNVL
jgi:glycosyltransferase involved in cell wall biosynthesis